jgi:hypothetical protein
MSDFHAIGYLVEKSEEKMKELYTKTVDSSLKQLWYWSGFMFSKLRHEIGALDCDIHYLEWVLQQENFLLHNERNKVVHCKAFFLLMGFGYAAPNHKEAFDLLRTLAAENHANALYNLGWCHFLGLGTMKDLECAISCWEKDLSIRLSNPDERIDIDGYLFPTPEVVDLRGCHLTAELIERLPFHSHFRLAKTIDIRENPQIVEIPSCFRHLNPLVTHTILIDPSFIQSGLEREIVTRGSKDIIQYCQLSVSGKRVPFKELKLLVVGKAAVGKTSLLRRLGGQLFSTRLDSTDGVDLGQVKIGSITFSTWDFGGTLLSAM